MAKNPEVIHWATLKQEGSDHTNMYGDWIFYAVDFTSAIEKIPSERLTFSKAVVEFNCR